MRVAYNFAAMSNTTQNDQKPRAGANQQTVNLSPELIANLDAIASRLNCVAMTGKNAGSPSWRSMIRFIAMGFLAVHRPGKGAIMIHPGGGDNGEKKRAPFKCHPNSPPKFWPADTGCMERTELEVKTRLSEKELREIGFSLTAGGTLWRAPRRWAAWNPVPVVPDWWDDVDGSGACLVANSPEGADLSSFDRVGDLLMFRREGGGK